MARREDIEGGPEGERLEGTQFNDDIDGNGGDDKLLGLGGNDELDGGRGNDRLLGGRGRDELDGGSGDDVLLGGKGNDRLEGDGGNDILTGGSGRDIFSFDERDGRDRITDFTIGQDRIEIDVDGIRGFDDLIIRTNKQGDTVIRWAGDDTRIKLVGVDSADLSASDFIFDT